MSCPWGDQELSTGWPWEVHGVTMRNPWGDQWSCGAHEQSMGRSWVVHGMSVSGSSVGWSWAVNGGSWIIHDAVFMKNPRGVPTSSIPNPIPMPMRTGAYFPINAVIASEHRCKRNKIYQWQTIYLRSFHSIYPITWQKGSVICPRLWNSLPPDNRNSSSLPIFLSKLKTHLFERALPP